MSTTIFSTIQDPYGRNAVLIEGVSDGVKFKATVDNAPPRVWGIIPEIPEKNIFNMDNIKKRIETETFAQFFSKKNKDRRINNIKTYLPKFLFRVLNSSIQASRYPFSNSGHILSRKIHSE